jgi:chitinase
MDSKKTRFSADGATVMVARVRVTREALCGRYLTFATHDVLRGSNVVRDKRVIGLPAGADRALVGAAPDKAAPDETGLERTRRWKLRQR